MMASEATSELKSVTSITYISMCTHGMFYKGHFYKGYCPLLSLGATGLHFPRNAVQDGQIHLFYYRKVFGKYSKGYTTPRG